MSKFLTTLRVRPIRRSTKRILLHPLVFRTDTYGSIIVPTGFITDYASIPKLIPRWIIDQDDPKIRDAAVIHDFLYSISSSPNKLTRKDADTILYQGCRKLGCSFTLGKLVYYAVRMFGKNKWKKD